jgi:hypothetical protein
MARLLFLSAFSSLFFWDRYDFAESRYLPGGTSHQQWTWKKHTVVGLFGEDGLGEFGGAIANCSAVSEISLQGSGSLSFVKWIEGSNFSSEIAFGLYGYNPVHKNPFRALPTVVLLNHGAENSLPKLDLLMDAWDDCAYRLLLPDGNKNSTACIQFYQEVARYMLCVLVSNLFRCDAVDSNAKPPKCNETCDHKI